MQFVCYWHSCQMCDEKHHVEHMSKLLHMLCSWRLQLTCQIPSHRLSHINQAERLRLACITSDCCFDRSSIQPPETAAASPSLPVPEQEEPGNEQQDALGSTAAQPATAPGSNAQEQGPEAQAYAGGTQANSQTDAVSESGRLEHNAAQHASDAGTSTFAAASTQRAASKQQSGASKPAVIRRAAKLPQTSRIQKSPALGDAGQAQRALNNAWSETCDIGHQLAVLYKLFGDAILPYVPMLPCMPCDL